MGPVLDYPRLRDWLGLPPGPWPPDHYALLGLPPGAVDPAEVEARALDRMGRLRPHQLVNPGLVTEGMNRLAQAIVCLCDPAVKAAYDAAHGPLSAPPPYEVVEPYEVDFRPGMGPPAEATEGGPVELPVGDRFEAQDRPGLPSPDVLPYELVDDLPPARPAEPASVPADPAGRRGVYRRLAALRRGLRAWEALRPVLTDPRDPLERPGQVLLLLEAAARVRAALPEIGDVVGRPGGPGGAVAAVVRGTHVLDTIRHLLLDQRQAVALDWRRGVLALEREYRRLRLSVRAARPVRPPRRGHRALARRFRETPEWVLVLLAAAAVLVALFRGGR